VLWWCWCFLMSFLELAMSPRNTFMIVLNDHRMNLQVHGIIVVAFHPECIHGIIICIFPKGRHGVKSLAWI
jgi:hypothetical protein